MRQPYGEGLNAVILNAPPGSLADGMLLRQNVS